MKVFFLASAIAIFLIGAQRDHHHVIQNAAYRAVYADSAYICDSKTAYAYHKYKNCRGLNRCTHRIVKISIDDAKNVYYRSACKICY